MSVDNSKAKSGAASNASQRQQASVKRMEAQKKAMEHKKENVELMQKFDANGNKKLERSELIALLTEADDSTPPGTPPSDEEVEWILRVADKPKRGEAADGCIDLFEMDDALTCFGTLKDVREELEAALDKYIRDPANPHVKKENFPLKKLGEFLSELNGGTEVTNVDQANVLKWCSDEFKKNAKAQHIPVKELLPATALWYSENKPPDSKCCVVQ